jgi:hypothetical protein
MAILAENNGGGNFERELIPSGIQVARSYSMIEIGTVTEEFKGQQKELKKIRISWELPYKMKVFKEGEPEKPMSISREFTLSMYEKASLRKFLESWRGKTYTEEEAKKVDVTKMLGCDCMITIIHKENKNGKMYAAVDSIAPMMDGMTCPARINPIKVLSYDAFDWDIYNALPEFLQNQMAATPEYGRLQAAMAAQNRNVATAQPIKPQEDPRPNDTEDFDNLPF